MGVPSIEKFTSFKQILKTFSNASDKYIKLLKSQIFFFNTPSAIQTHISIFIGFQKSSLPSNYLVGRALTTNP